MGARLGAVDLGRAAREKLGAVWTEHNLPGLRPEQEQGLVKQTA